MDIESPERSIWPRIIAALSELGCATWLGWVWLNPDRAGLDGVLAAFAVVVLEWPLLMVLALIIIWVSAVADLKSRIYLAVVLAGVVGFTILVTSNIAGHLQDASPYLLAVFAGTFLGKWMTFQDGRHNDVVFEIAKVFVQFVALVVCFGLATSFAPRLGFDADTMARLDIPKGLDIAGGARSPYDNSYAFNGDPRFHGPWGFIAAGMFYFAIHGVFRFLTFTRTSR